MTPEPAPYPEGAATSDPASARVVVTRSAYRPEQPRGRAPRVELDDQTSLGSSYLSSLIRTQIRTALVVLILLAVPSAFLPLVLAHLPKGTGGWGSQAAVGWLTLGVAAYPLLVALGWWYVRQVDENERAFTRLVESD
jgi:hypothetical protein